VKEYSQDLGDLICLEQNKAVFVKKMNTALGLPAREKLKVL